MTETFEPTARKALNYIKDSAAVPEWVGEALADAVATDEFLDDKVLIQDQPPVVIVLTAPGEGLVINGDRIADTATGHDVTTLRQWRKVVSLALLQAAMNEVDQVDAAP